MIGCGSANLNKIFGTEDDSYSALLQRAQVAYDRGDFDTAEDLATKAYDRTTNNGDAGVLLGNIYLSQAGIDIFQVVRKMSSLSKQGSGSSPSSTCSSSSSGGASSTNSLGQLSCLLLNLSDADKAALGSVQSFPDLSVVGVTEVYIPSEVTDELRANVSTLSALDKGIRKICPFVSRSVVLSQSIDLRHTDTSICPDKTNTSFSSAKAHISFALLHLIEALVFQQGVLIDGVASNSSTTGVQTVSSKISKTNFASATDLVKAVTSLKTIVDASFDTTNESSQLALALNGLIMVNQSFEVAGVPSSVTSAIGQQLTKLRQTASALKTSSGGSSSDTTYQAQALKGQMNESYAKAVATKINTQCPSAGSCASEKTSLCQSYASISLGVDPAKLEKPTICK
jgi:hypothetical protein